jgi:hypothetical protein
MHWKCLKQTMTWDVQHHSALLYEAKSILQSEVLLFWNVTPCSPV